MSVLCCLRKLLLTVASHLALAMMERIRLCLSCLWQALQLGLSWLWQALQLVVTLAASVILTAVSMLLMLGIGWALTSLFDWLLTLLSGDSMQLFDKLT